jgi:hypothetical protein
MKYDVKILKEIASTIDTQTQKKSKLKQNGPNLRTLDDKQKLITKLFKEKSKNFLQNRKHDRKTSSSK